MVPSRSHPLAVSRIARLADATIARVWRARITPKPPLEPEYLWQVGSRGYTRADEHGGRDEVEVADFRERVDRMCSALPEAQLNSLGHTLAYGQLTSAIRTRHALGRLWRTNPQLTNTRIAPPIAVVGQMRAGTTRVHRLLAADPRHAGTRFCDSLHPVPSTPDWRPLKAAMALAIARRINPWLDTLHPFGARRADEEIGWLSAALSPCAYEAQWRIPSFVAWSESADQRPVYREFARILRTDSVIRRNTDRPRVLKCPQFSEDIAALIAELPETRIVEATRDSAAVLDSAVSMVASQSAFQSDAGDLAVITSEWRRKLALRAARLAECPVPRAIVDYEALNADWLAAITEVYSALGLRLTGQAVTAMAREQRAAVSSPHHAHSHVLDRFAHQRG